MKRLICKSLILICLHSFLFAASNTFLPMGPSPSFNEELGSNNSDAGCPNPVLVHPTDANLIFTGGVNGGIWRTFDFGLHWEALSDRARSLSIASLSFDAFNLSKMFAGVGITSNGGIGNGGGVQARGGPRIGILYSLDAGNTWQDNLLGNSILEGKSVVAVEARNFVPNSSGTVLAALFEPQDPTDFTNYGLYRSVDGGSTFLNYTQIDPVLSLKPGPATGLDADKSDANILYVCQTTPNSGSTTFADSAVYKSQDGGTTWAPIFTAADSGGLINNAMQTVLDVVTGPNDSVAVKIVQIDNQGVDRAVGVFLSTDGGTNWDALPMPTENVNPDGQGIVNSDIEIDPTDPTTVYLTGTFLDEENFPLSAYILKPATPAVSFSLPSNGTIAHADSRFLAFDAAGRLLVGTDGGIAVRTNPASSNGTWQSINGNLSLWQPYGASYDANHNLIMTAGQDTGCSLQEEPNSIVYNTLPLSGDGINATINDQGETSYYYSSAQALDGLNRIIDGKLSTMTFLNLNPNPALFFGSPFVLNRVDGKKIAIGGADNIYITVDTQSDTLELTPVGPQTVESVAIAYGTNDNPDALVAGSNNFPFLFFSSDPQNSDLAPLAAFGAAGGNIPVTAVFDPRSENRFFVADGINLFQTQDQGASFANLTPIISQVALNIARPTGLEFLSNNGVNVLFVGGINNSAEQSPLVFANADILGNLTDWQPFGKLTLPNTIISGLTYNNKSDTLLASAFGRGLFLMYDVTSNFPQAEELWFGRANNDSIPDMEVLTNGNFVSRPLKKFGKGTLTITNAASYTGLTTILEGILELRNLPSRILGDVVVQNGGILNGIGTVDGNVTVQSGGIIQPGNASNNTLGVLNVGSLNLEEGSKTKIELTTTQSSMVNVLGVASLGGNVLLNQIPGNYPAFNTYQILTAQGLLGSFNPQVLGGLPGFNFFLLQTQNSVFLRYGALIPITILQGNNLALAEFLNTSAFGFPAQTLLTGLSGDALNDALSTIDPVRNTYTTFVEDNTLFGVSDLLSNHFSATHTNRLLNCGCSNCCESRDLWVGSFVEFASQDGLDQTPSFDFDTESIFLGFDFLATRNVVLGAAAGYAHSNLQQSRNFGSGEIDYFLFAPYGTLYCGNGYFEMAATFAWDCAKNRRHIFFPGFDARASSAHDVFHVMPHFGLGYDLNFICGTLLEPFLQIDWAYNNECGYRERGTGVYDFATKGNTSSMLRSEGGLRWFQMWTKPCGTFVLREEVAYVDKRLFSIGERRFQLLGINPLPGLPNSLSLSTLQDSQHLLTVGISGFFKTTCGFYGMLSFDTEQSSSYRSYDLQAKLGKFF